MAASGATSLESLIQRDRLWIAGGLAGAIALCWAWLVPAAIDMQGDMNGLAAWMMSPSIDARYLFLLFLMWAVMMAGMMLPSAAPTLLLYARVARSGAGNAIASVYAFAAGYIVVWSGFSLAATLLQWALHDAGLLSPMMQSASRALSGGLLVIAGAYQWSSLKQRCLSSCRGPAAFIAQHWRPGVGGALRMGVRHGLFCLGCCWALMLLLFAGGVMSLACIAAITIFVLLEKLAPLGAYTARAAGTLLVGAGAWLALG
jgi:predicted metal-binding membrane protein